LRPPRCSAATGNELPVPAAGTWIVRTTSGLVFGDLGMAAYARIHPPGSTPADVFICRDFVTDRFHSLPAGASAAARLASAVLLHMRSRIEAITTSRK